ncbi:hypothetical protein CBR_g40146 [Chara braunii]|uniref:Uncharacterized protein n=1 Tax=Chara braunii TaxID=69332 RepID=A0A388LT69_CHABU|nr:hypothetical protein CBR_g40146 [Chara braunii]|eukprot:GBG85507.1 hypothetical protein CBR_g40146 [Chara braunii]
MGVTRFDKEDVSRPSTSQDPDLQKRIDELGKDLATVSAFVQTEMARKAEEERLTKEAEEEEQCKADEKLQREKKEHKRLEKRRKEEEHVADIEKKVKLQVAIYISDQGSSSERDKSEEATKEIRAKTGRLVISEKRKRGPESDFEGSPPMLTPAKRTPKTSKPRRTGGTVRVTRSRAQVKTKLSPYVEKAKKSSRQSGTVAKLRFRNQAIEELRGLDAHDLQAICKEEGIAYNGKIDAIFDIASHRTRKAFGEVEPIDLSGVMGETEGDTTAVGEEGNEAEA